MGLLLQDQVMAIPDQSHTHTVSGTESQGTMVWTSKWRQFSKDVWSAHFPGRLVVSLSVFHPFQHQMILKSHHPAGWTSLSISATFFIVVEKGTRAMENSD